MKEWGMGMGIYVCIVGKQNQPNGCLLSAVLNSAKQNFGREWIEYLKTKQQFGQRDNENMEK